MARKFQYAFALFLVCGTLSFAFGKADSTVGDNDMIWSTYPSPSPVKTFAVSNGAIWYVNEEEFLVADPKKKGLTHLATIATIPASAVSEMDADNSGRIFIGSSMGLGVKTIKDAPLLTTKEGLPSNEVTTLHASRNGDVWVATTGGLCVYRNGVISSFATVGPAALTVNALCSDGKGMVYAGTKKGLFIYNGSAWSKQSSVTGMSDDPVVALGYDYRESSVWATVGDADVNSYNGKTWKIFTGVKNGISGLFADTYSRIWFATPDGLMKFNGDEWVSDPSQIGISIPKLFKIAVDIKGNMFFATDKGVISLNNPYPH